MTCQRHAVEEILSIFLKPSVHNAFLVSLKKWLVIWIEYEDCDNLIEIEWPY